MKISHHVYRVSQSEALDWLLDGRSLKTELMERAAASARDAAPHKEQADFNVYPSERGQTFTVEVTLLG